MRIANWALVVLLVAPVPLASAQQQEDSLAAASRRAQEEKKTQPKAGKVWDNDNLPTGNVNVVGQTPPAAETTAAAGAAEGNAPSLSPEEKAAIEEDLKSAQEKLDSLKTDADILQRKFVLDSQMYYGKPNYAADREGAAAIQAEKDQVDAKMDEVAAAQKEVDALQAKLQAAAGSSSTTPAK